MSFKIFIVFCITIKAFCSSKYVANNLDSIIRKNEIVPDVIDSVPTELIKVTWSRTISANLGNELKPNTLIAEPSVHWPTEKGECYTLMMLDPDTPSRKEPTLRQIKHWLVVNIPENQVSKGRILAEYIGPQPEKDTALHRYVLVVYKQNGSVILSETRNDTRASRAKFNNKQFVEKYHLGGPVAINFYQAQFDGLLG